jgi:hypothetical protein
VTRRHRARGEDGTSLSLALIFVTIFGLVIGGLLDLATTNVVNVTTFEAERGDSYAAEGALDAAIQQVRSGMPAVIAGSCPPYAATINGRAAQVTCERTNDPAIPDPAYRFTATVGGALMARADVVYRLEAGGVRFVDVLDWQHCHATPTACA